MGGGLALLQGLDSRRRERRAQGHGDGGEGKDPCRALSFPGCSPQLPRNPEPGASAHPHPFPTPILSLPSWL